MKRIFGPALVATAMLMTATPRGALASSAFGVGAKPLRVTFEPAAPASATAVRIEGLIALGGTTQDFVTPACGYLYYQCKAGDEALCREQWQDLATAAQSGLCALFMSRRDDSGALANPGRLRPLDETPVSPDVYSARSGLGVMTMVCGAEFSAACTLTGGVGGMGVGGRTGAGGGGAGGTAASTGGATATGGADAGGKGGAPTVTASGGAGGMSVPVDAGLDAAPDASVKTAKGGGCSVAGAGATWGALLGGALLALGLARRRRGGA